MRIIVHTTHDSVITYHMHYSAIMAMFSVVDDDVHVAINGQLSEI